MSGLNPVIDLNEDHAAAQSMNVQQTLGNLAQFKADAAQIPFELTNGNNQLLNMNDDNENAAQIPLELTYGNNQLLNMNDDNDKDK